MYNIQEHGLSAFIKRLYWGGNPPGTPDQINARRGAWRNIDKKHKKRVIISELANRALHPISFIRSSRNR